MLRNRDWFSLIVLLLVSLVTAGALTQAAAFDVPPAAQPFAVPPAPALNEGPAQHIEVVQEYGDTLFDGMVRPGETFSFTGTGSDNQLGPKILVKLNGEVRTELETGCVQAIGPNLVSGDFVVIAGTSKDGGPLCPLPPADVQCAACAGGATTLTLWYRGALADAHVEVLQDTSEVVFDGTLQPGAPFSFIGAHEGNRLGNQITVQVNGQVNTTIDTSCAQAIGPGLISGDFEVAAGASQDGGALCRLPDPACGSCGGGVTWLKLQYLPYEPGQVLAGFQAGTPLEVIDNTLRSLGAERKSYLDPLSAWKLGTAPSNEDALVKGLQQSSIETFAEQNYRTTASFTPNDPYYATQQYGPQITRSNLAWDITTGSSSVVIGIVDSGVSAIHEDLAGRVLPGWDFFYNDDDASDDSGHGTHVAGIAAATINNGLGIAGISQSSILPVKVLDRYNGGNHFNIAKGIIWATDHGAKIINLSLGAPASTEVLYNAVEYAWNHGVLLVAAAGNGATNTPYYPAGYPHVMAVAATNASDERWTVSNFGNHISVSAPGDTITSTIWTSTDPVSSYKDYSGTSMAAPHVCGIAALLLAQNSNRTNAELRSIIESTADDLYTPGWDPYFGYGRVNAYRALTYGQPTPTPTMTPTPTPVVYLQRVNAGSSSYTDKQGLIWAADQAWNGSWGYVGGSAKSSTTAVAGTDDDLLYQKWRDGMSEYRFAVPNGVYQVTLRFAEFEVSKATDRVMRITMEGVVVENALSIYGLVGKATALDRVYPQVIVSDGQLNILFAKSGSSRKTPVVSAIEVWWVGPPPPPTATPTATSTATITPTPTVTPTPMPYLQRVNAGDANYRDGLGQVWAADQLYTTGSWGYTTGSAKSSTNPVAGTDDDLLYQKYREKPGEYRFTVPNGTYQVTLRFAEFVATNATDRNMQITIEGVVVEGGLSIYALVGRNTALDRAYAVTVNDGLLNIVFARGSGAKKDPVVSAIEVKTQTQ